MIVNGKKTKEMLIGSVIKNPPASLLLNDTDVDRVSTLKLLGVHICNDVKWTQHVDAISSRIASRLYFAETIIETCRSDFQRSVVLLLHSHPSNCWICESSLALQPDRFSVWRSRVIAETSHERCVSWLRLYNGVNYRWCRHAAQSSWGAHSAFLYPTDTCWTRHPVFTTCCHRSETTTLRQNAEELECWEK